MIATKSPGTVSKKITQRLVSFLIIPGKEINFRESKLQNLSYPGYMQKKTFHSIFERYFYTFSLLNLVV
jgi:hypothetical protein